MKRLDFILVFDTAETQLPGSRVYFLCVLQSFILKKCDERISDERMILRIHLIHVVINMTLPDLCPLVRMAHPKQEQLLVGQISSIQLVIYRPPFAEVSKLNSAKRYS
eukprot:SAG31_NODE_1129_length_9755_cov_2.095070_4_plen_108_part_00